MAAMPTASTAQICQNTESFEPCTSNIYTRKTLGGDFTVVNKQLVRKLESMGKWTEDTRKTIIRDRGSVRNVTGLSVHQKNVFKTVWEVKMRKHIDHAAARQKYIDQSQSMNLYFATPDLSKLSASLIYGWRRGLKTGSYYTRTLPAANAKQVTSDIKNEEECLSCGS